MDEAIKPIVSLKQLEKSFGSNRVLKDVSLDLYCGKITALLGANGAGKSTLIKVLAGLYEKSSGEIYVQGKQVEITSPLESAHHGIQIVHQRVSDSIVPGLTVAENLCFEEISNGTISSVAGSKKIRARAKEIMKTLELDWDDDFLQQDVDCCGIADGQLLLLARALINNPRVLILDEPTSTLSQSEVERLFEKIISLRERGVAILYVSHRMGEIKRLADELVVLRDGRIVHKRQAPFDLPQAIDAMLGNAPGTGGSVQIEEHRGENEVITIRDLHVLPRSEAMNLGIRQGEVTGILGLIGSGKTELAECIYGMRSTYDGKILYNGIEKRLRHPQEAVKQGIFLVPEDRVEQAMIPEWSIKQTATLPFLSSVTRMLGVVSNNGERIRAQNIIEELKVVCTDENQNVDSLSGGNQQKVIVGRWLLGNPKTFILDEPFRGVDIGARREISAQLRKLASEGATVIVLSSDVDEIKEVSDRIVVLVDGAVHLDSYNSEVDFDAIVKAMSEVA